MFRAQVVRRVERRDRLVADCPHAPAHLHALLLGFSTQLWISLWVSIGYSARFENITGTFRLARFCSKCGLCLHSSEASPGSTISEPRERGEPMWILAPIFVLYSLTTSRAKFLQNSCKISFY
jgi:hypothetical protein